MYRTRTPRHRHGSRRAAALRTALRVSGTVTVLSLIGFARPTAIQAQAIGTMQVVARVTPAGAAWDGLTAAQNAAREFAAAPTLDRSRLTDHSLTQVVVDPLTPRRANRRTLAISIQYLRN